MSNTPEQDLANRSNANTRLITFLDMLAGTNSDKATAEVLQTAFRVQFGDSARAQANGLSRIYRMIEFAEAEAKLHYALMWNTIAPHFNATHACFTPVTCHVPWNQRKQALSPQHLTGLRHTAEHLRVMGVSEVILQDQDLEPVRNAITEMEAFINDADLPEHARGVLLAQLRKIRLALEDYSIFGVEELQVALSSFVGTVATDPQLLRALHEPIPARKRVWTSFLAIVTALGAIIGVANQTHDLAKNFLPGVRQLLGLPAPATNDSRSLEPEPHIERI